MGSIVRASPCGGAPGAGRRARCPRRRRGAPPWSQSPPRSTSCRPPSRWTSNCPATQAWACGSARAARSGSTELRNTSAPPPPPAARNDAGGSLPPQNPRPSSVGAQSPACADGLGRGLAAVARPHDPSPASAAFTRGRAGAPQPTVPSRPAVRLAVPPEPGVPKAPVPPMPEANTGAVGSHSRPTKLGHALFHRLPGAARAVLGNGALRRHTSTGPGSVSSGLVRSRAAEGSALFGREPGAPTCAVRRPMKALRRAIHKVLYGGMCRAFTPLTPPTPWRHLARREW